ncbi:MAG TPA: hypothetical protein VGQ57_04090, partial [Polyangiaceae bacterium]|nr:hypothetical protein [Polyangiaceae bacterium]
GPPSENPECDPGAGFPNGSDAHWIAAPDAGTAVFRKRIRIAPVGFGEGTTGGSNAEPVLVAHDDLDGLVEALKSDTPGVVVLEEGLPYDVHKTGDDVTMTEACPTACDGSDKMTLNLLPDDAPPCAMPEVVARNERKLHVGSNKTLVGLGRGAQLLGGTLALGDSQNVVVRNVALYDINPDLIEAGDGISIDGADGVWVDHVTFKDISDGFIDATKNSKNLTFSWVRNDGDNPKACLDRHPRSNELSVTTATIHHTLWEHVNGRAPLATHEGSRVHLFDNVVSDFVGYAVGSACGAEVLLETSTFDGTGAPTLKATCSDAPDEVGSIGARGLGNRYSASVGPHQVGNATAGEPNDAVWRPTYAYTTDGADTSQFVVPQRAGAGSRWRLPIPPAP